MTSQKTNVKMRTMIIPVAVPALLQVAVPLRARVSFPALFRKKLN